MELILTGETIDAKDALSLGLINKIVPPEKLEGALHEMISKISVNSGSVLQMTKKAMLSGEGLSFEEALRKARDIYLNQLMALEDTNEGLKAVIEKRTPLWKDK